MSDNREEAAKFVCADCSREFNRKFNFTRHARVHQQKVKNVVCGQCFKTFASANNLKTHLIDHHGEKMPMTPPETTLVSNKGKLVEIF